MLTKQPFREWRLKLDAYYLYSHVFVTRVETVLQTKIENHVE